MIKLKNVSKYYYSKGIVSSGFSKINLELNVGEFVAITGESGSGKSTLLNVISGIDSYEDGEMYINGEETSHYTEVDYENYRRKYIGIIFQNFNLINSYTVYQNIELVTMLNGEKERKEKILKLIEMVGLTKYKNTKVSKLSGGQKQRVAIARALAKDTPIIIADEPTGNLDSKSAKEVMKTLHDISKDKLVVVVTHNYDQVEKYATRKITMNDGKILDDKKFKTIEPNKNVILSEYKSMNIVDKIRLGIRNAFNIKAKFILLFSVFLFMVVALLSEYASVKSQKYEEENMGFNEIFTDVNPKRIIIKKADNSEIKDEEFSKIENIKEISEIYKNDILLDTKIELTDNDSTWLEASLLPIENCKKKIDIGRMPEKSNEIVISGSKDEYYIHNYEKYLINKNFYILDNSTSKVNSDNNLKIVGIIYNAKNDYSMKAYGKKELIDKMEYTFNQTISNIKYLFQDKYHEIDLYQPNNQIIPNDLVPEGTVIIPDTMNSLCKDENCINKPLKIEIKNSYYSSELNLNVKKYFTKKNMKQMLGLENYDENNLNIFVNTNQYNSLFNKETYQASVYVRNVDELEITRNKLKDLGYKVLVMKDTYSDLGNKQINDIIQTTLIIILIITLFFICYFVIKIILNSRNIYYSTIRILGATKWIVNQLLIVELFTVMNLSYFIFIILIRVSDKLTFIKSKGIIDYFSKLRNFVGFNDYIILYIIIMSISLLISQKFAKSLFKKSALNTMKEEV